MAPAPGDRITASNTILYCQRFSETLAFYAETLGFEISWRTDWFVEFRLPGASFLSVADAARASVGSSRGRGLTLSFRVDDAALARKELKDKGVPVTEILFRWESRTFFFKDPEGHRIEFWEHCPGGP